MDNAKPRTHCRHGHELAVVGLTNDGKRCLECRRKTNRESAHRRFAVDPEPRRRATREGARRRRKTDPEGVRKTKRAHYQANPERVREQGRHWREVLRREVLLAYGDGSCAKCEYRPEDALALELDHTYGGGRAHRAQTSHGGGFYTYLKRSGWPTDPPLQTLCKPCHRAKHAQRAA
jgi:hypothetical protein